MDSKLFYDTLFEAGEWTCFGFTPFENTSYEYTEGYNDRARFFTINPLIKGKTRKGSNVKRYRNLMFEIDNIGVPEQVELIKKSNLPYSTATFSGGKSIHWIISLDSDLSDRIEYTALWKACNAALQKHGIVADAATKDPARFSRCPNSTRDNGKLQKLLKVHGKISFEVLNDWLVRNEINWEDYIPKQDFNTTSFTTSSVDDGLKIDWVEKYYMKNDRYEEGNRHLYQVKLAYLLLRTGMDANSIERYIVSKYGELSSGINNVNSLKDSVSGDLIYVPSIKERKEYYRNLENEERVRQIQSRYAENTIDNAVDNLLSEDINRYIRVGTKYFKVDPLNNGLLDWDKGTFQDDYGRGTLPPRLYDGFKYKPDYISEEFPADLFNGKFRNKFERPGYEITEGDWSTIRGALKHAFKDQYDLVLKMCTVMLKWPETRLPVLILLGEEGVGKSAIIKIFQYLLGNSKSIKSKQFESEFDGFLMDTQLLVIEEAGGWKDPSAVADEFKRLATEVGEIEINPKYGKQTEYPWYGWLMCTSNDLTPIRMEGAATRFWVVEMTKIEKPVENYYDKVKAEMGHFAHYLLNEVQVDHPNTRSERLYFAPEEYWTPAKDFVKDINKSDTYSRIKDLFEEYFEKFDDEVLYFDLKSLKTRLVDCPGDKDLKVCLAKEFGIKNKTSNLARPNGLLYFLENGEYSIPEKKTQWYTVNREDYVNDLTDQMNQIMRM